MKRSKFSLSHYRLFSCNMGSLIPIGCVEVLPGDTVQHATSALVRASPLLSPVMHPVSVRIHHWFVPHRLVWEDWEDFITGGPDGEDDSEFPTITIGGGSGAAVGSLADYLGVPPGVNNIEVSALPFRAYALIWNNWYRDQDLQTALVIDETSGADSTTSTALQRCGWEKDYFTSARPWEQKGPAITIPLGTTAPVSGIAIEAGDNAAAAGADFIGVNAGSDWTNASNQPMWNGLVDTIGIKAQSVAAASASNRPQIFADLSSASAITINLLREAFALQRFEEARARFGSRYVEYLRYLGVRSSDARLALPEYLGGGRNTIQWSEVVGTNDTKFTGGGTAVAGTLRGHGIAAMRSNRYRRFFEEHGYVMSLMSVRPKTIYANGLARTFNRRTKEDFFQKELQHIGQQAVLNKEVYAAHSAPNDTFGFQDRYDEYRRQESNIAGEFRSSTLDFWHFARIFSSDPALNASFVACEPTERTFAVNTTDVLWIMANHSIQARRLLASTGSSFIY